MKKTLTSSLKISSSFLGSLIGAGFASGQEVLIYFSRFDRFGLFGIIVCTLLFFLLISGICFIIRRCGADSFQSLLRITCGHTGARIFYAVFLLSTFVAFGGMTSGFGASLEQHTGLDSRIGALVFLIIMMIVMRAGERGVVAVNVALTPIMIAVVLFVCIHILYFGTISTSANATTAISSTKSAFLYAGYNGIISIAVISQLSHYVKSRAVSLFSALISSASFAILLIPLYEVTTRNANILSSHEIPMLYAASQIHPIMGHIYFLVLLMAMITTGACCGFSLCTSLGVNMKKGAIMLPVFAIPFIFIDFSFLVSRLYSLIGIAGALLLMIIICRAFSIFIKDRKRRHI